MQQLAEGIAAFTGPRTGPVVCLSFGVHGNERSPITAGQRLQQLLAAGQRALSAGRLILQWSNPRASQEDQRWSRGGIDLNRCFSDVVLARDPERYEERRAREIVALLESEQVEILVDFHCTVEPGRRFLMQHPAVDDEPHRRAWSLLQGDTLLADPGLQFGGVSLDEWMSTRGRVGICYETGWKDDPSNTPESVLGEMLNLLSGLGLMDGAPARTWQSKQLLQLERVLVCAEEGFAWALGVGENLQALAAGTELGRYASGTVEVLAEDAALIFPKKRPELLQVGKPLVYLARPMSSP